MLELLKPEYLWRPTQVLRRLSYRPIDQFTQLPLPWRCNISACPAETIGRSIATQGVLDLPMTEALVRLTDPGDTALDLGGNIGYMTLVLALAAGPEGRVRCFEPNPKLLANLRTNVCSWNSLEIAPIQIETVALSDWDGEADLGFPDDYATNQGVASLEATKDGVPVSIRRLDSLGIERADIMKVDVEGHEAVVFRGAERLLARRSIRDILFEEHGTYPAASHKILLECGYHVFRLTRSTWRPLLLPPETPARQIYLPSNYLATTDVSRARAQFASWGWRALSADLRNGKAASH